MCGSGVSGSHVTIGEVYSRIEWAKFQRGKGHLSRVGNLDCVALLQLDITNAFNTCDRARLLSELYGQLDLQSLYRITDLAYSQPSVLVLSGCNGLMIESAQGVGQGDPLSALLFCLYVRDVLQRVSEQTGVRVYGFFDDINLLGTPQQLLAALSHLQQSLPAVSLQLNTAKSNFAYFHDSLTPLTSAVLSTLSANDIQLHHDWVGVVGAVVGRDDTAIRAGIHSVLSAAGGTHDAFLRRLQLDEMPIQTAMLLLRIYHCIQTVGLSSALQMWAPCWPSVCNTSVVGVQATAALCSASWYASEGGEMWCDESGSLKVANSVGSVCGRVGSV